MDTINIYTTYVNYENSTPIEWAVVIVKNDQMIYECNRKNKKVPQIIDNTHNCWATYIGELCAITTALYWIRKQKQKHISCINFYYTLKKSVSLVSGQHTPPPHFNDLVYHSQVLLRQLLFHDKSIYFIPSKLDDNWFIRAQRIAVIAVI